MFHDDPSRLTADERTDEIAALLAAGFLRLKRRMRSVPTGQVRTSLLHEGAEIITETRRRNAESNRSHVKERRRRLRELGIELSSLRCCTMNHVAL